MKTAFKFAVVLGLTPLIGAAGDFSKSPIQPKEPIEERNLYIFGYGGGSYFENDNLLFDWQGAPRTAAVVDLDEGFIAGGGIGIYSDMFGGSRFELEGIYSKFGTGFVTDPQVNLAGTSTSAGDFSYTAVLVNLLKEFELSRLGITAYAGGGLGMAWTDSNFYSAQSSAYDGGSALAYQIIVGADFPLNDRLDLYTQYKLIGIGETSAIDNGVPFASTPFGYSVDDFFTHNVIVGLKWRF